MRGGSPRQQVALVCRAHETWWLRCANSSSLPSGRRARPQRARRAGRQPSRDAAAAVAQLVARSRARRDAVSGPFAAGAAPTDATAGAAEARGARRARSRGDAARGAALLAAAAAACDARRRNASGPGAGRHALAGCRSAASAHAGVPSQQQRGTQCARTRGTGGARAMAPAPRRRRLPPQLNALPLVNAPRLSQAALEYRALEEACAALVAGRSRFANPLRALRIGDERTEHAHAGSVRHMRFFLLGFR